MSIRKDVKSKILCIVQCVLLNFCFLYLDNTYEWSKVFNSALWVSADTYSRGSCTWVIWLCVSISASILKLSLFCGSTIEISLSFRWIANCLFWLIVNFPFCHVLYTSYREIHFQTNRTYIDLMIDELY